MIRTAGSSLAAAARRSPDDRDRLDRRDARPLEVARAAGTRAMRSRRQLLEGVVRAADLDEAHDVTADAALELDQVADVQDSSSSPHGSARNFESSTRPLRRSVAVTVDTRSGQARSARTSAAESTVLELGAVLIGLVRRASGGRRAGARARARRGGRRGSGRSSCRGTSSTAAATASGPSASTKCGERLVTLVDAGRLPRS